MLNSQLIFPLSEEFFRTINNKLSNESSSAVFTMMRDMNVGKICEYEENSAVEDEIIGMNKVDVKHMLF